MVSVKLELQLLKRDLQTILWYMQWNGKYIQSLLGTVIVKQNGRVELELLLMWNGMGAILLITLT